jgi:glycosyltransferase domain-containing protein
VLVEKLRTYRGSIDAVTVVVPTYNRSRQLAETVLFLESIGLRAVVVDGSSERHPDFERFHPALVRYFHRPQSTYQERMAFAAAIVDTPYTLSMSDDEYYCPDAIVEAVNFLDNNKDYTSCGGEAVGFSLHDGALEFDEVYPELRGFDMTLDSPAARMEAHLSKYRPASYYAVVRTGIWAYAWTEISKHQFSPNGVSELQFEAAVSFAGKMKVLPKLMWWRNLITPPIRALGDPDNFANVTILEWWNRDSFASERRAFLDVMTALLNGLPTSTVTPANYESTFRAFQGYSRRNWWARVLLRELPKAIVLKTLSLIGLGRGRQPAAIPRHLLGKNTMVDLATFHAILLRLSRFHRP